MANQQTLPTQNNGNNADSEVVDSIRTIEPIMVPAFGHLNVFLTHPPQGGKGWIIKPHREGFKVTHPDLTAKYGWWVIYRANISSTCVDIPAQGAK